MCCAARVCIGFWPDFHPASFYAFPFTSALTAVRMQLTGHRSFNASSSVKLAHSNKAAGPSAEREAKTRRPVCFSMWSGVFYAGVMAGFRLVRRIGSLPNLPNVEVYTHFGQGNKTLELGAYISLPTDHQKSGGYDVEPVEVN